MVYIQHIVFKYAGHRTLICTTHKPWWLYILFWVKPLRVDYIGHGTQWHVVLGRKGGKLITDQRLVRQWMATRLQQFEAKKLTERSERKNLSTTKKLFK